MRLSKLRHCHVVFLGLRRKALCFELGFVGRTDCWLPLIRGGSALAGNLFESEGFLRLGSSSKSKFSIQHPGEVMFASGLRYLFRLAT